MPCQRVNLPLRVRGILTYGKKAENRFCDHLRVGKAPQAGLEPATRCLEGSRSIL